jgi:hypothetical protein
MAIPQVTFPLTQEQVKETHEMLYKHLRGLQADARITQELLKTVQQFCSHPNKARCSCPDCGADWGD